MISLMLLIILQWNARSLIANGQVFKKYIDKLMEKPNIISVQETCLKPEFDFIIIYLSLLQSEGIEEKVEGEELQRLSKMESATKFLGSTRIMSQLRLGYGLKMAQ